jgi:CDP-6-deoxy-D-xylo-4-hexulose-3-dehydrase
MAYRIPLAFSTFTGAEIKAATDVLNSGRLTQGQEVAAFEKELAEWHGVPHAILVNSGSSANLIAIEAAIYLSRLIPDRLFGPIEAGDEVIIQGLNWPSTLKPILNHGLRPVFCDVDIQSLNAGVGEIEAARTNRTRMVVAVPVLGNPSHLEELRDYCDQNRLILIEDACESLGALTEDNHRVGTLGLASAHSFYFSHHLTTIEGGAVLTSDPQVADLCRALRAHGWSRELRMDGFLRPEAAEVDERFCFVMPGYNVRSTELNAAIGRVQLASLNHMLARRREVARGRRDAIAQLADRITVPGADIVDRHSWMATPLLFTSREHRDRARASLEASGVETRPIIVGNMLRHPLVKMIGLSEAQKDLPMCDEVFGRGLMIGLSPVSTEEDEAIVHEALVKAATA